MSKSYGFVISATDRQIVNFCNKHIDTVAQLVDHGSDIVEYLREHDGKDNVDDFCEKFYDYESCISGESGAYGIIADVMWQETGIRFEYRRHAEPDDSPEYIVFSARLPWEYNEKERNLDLFAGKEWIPGTADFGDLIRSYIDDFDGLAVVEDIFLDAEYFDT